MVQVVIALLLNGSDIDCILGDRLAGVLNYSEVSILIHKCGLALEPLLKLLEVD